MDTERKGLIFSKGRLETLTDGVFAILMTILVFNISVPEFILFTRDSTLKRDFLIDLLVYGLISWLI